MNLKKATLNRSIKVVTLRHKGKYVCHLTYNKGFIMDYLMHLLTWLKALSVASTILIGFVCWLLFSLVLIGCSTPTEAPEESGYSQDFCYMNDSIYKIEGKRYEVGKTERATIWIDSSGNLWRHGKDGKIIPVDYSDTERCGN